MQTVSWTNMADGTREDYQRLKPAFFDYAMDRLVDNVVGLLEQLRGPKLGYPVDRYEHSLQAGSRALRAGEGPDLVVGALLHDMADTIAPDNHSDAAAAILAPYIDDETHWIVKHHGIFQGYYYFHHVDGDRNARDRFADSPHFDACARFCERYDQNCFDPDYPNLDIADFRPMLDEVFSRPSKLGHLPPKAKEKAIGGGQANGSATAEAAALGTDTGSADPTNSTGNTDNTDNTVSINSTDSSPS